MRQVLRICVMLACLLLLVVTLSSWLASYLWGVDTWATRVEILTNKTASFRTYQLSVLEGRILLATFSHSGPTRRPGQPGAATWSLHRDTDSADDTVGSRWLTVLSDNGVSFMGLGFVAGSDLAVPHYPVLPESVNMVALTLPHWLFALILTIIYWRVYRRLCNGQSRGFEVVTNPDHTDAAIDTHQQPRA